MKPGNILLTVLGLAVMAKPEPLGSITYFPAGDGISMSLASDGSMVRISWWGGDPVGTVEIWRGKTLLATKEASPGIYTYQERNLGVASYSVIQGDNRAGRIFSRGRLSWNPPSSGPRPEGYRVYVYRSSGIMRVYDVGPATSVPIIALGIESGRYVAAVTSYIGNHESERCAPVGFRWHNTLRDDAK